MNDCERLSDRMPDVALGRGGWTPDEAAHLAGCAECRAEWRLVLAARALERGAPTVSDPSALAGTLQRRLAEDLAVRSRARRAWAFAGAAAAAAATPAADQARRARARWARSTASRTLSAAGRAERLETAGARWSSARAASTSRHSARHSRQPARWAASSVVHPARCAATSGIRSDRRSQSFI
jgi:hypothetical protein